MNGGSYTITHTVNISVIQSIYLWASHIQAYLAVTEPGSQNTGFALETLTCTFFFYLIHFFPFYACVILVRNQFVYYDIYTLNEACALAFLHGRCG